MVTKEQAQWAKNDAKKLTYIVSSRELRVCLVTNLPNRPLHDKIKS